MQKVYLRKPKAPADYTNQQANKIMHFSLQDSLPSGHIMALNMTFGTLSYLTSDATGIPRLLKQEQFTNTEMSVLLPLLELFPYYCPYEVLYAGFYGGGKASEESIAAARQHLDEAMAEGIWDQEMRPVRCALSRTRLKMRSFNIDISSILATGYILLIAGEPDKEEEYEDTRRLASRR
ncbi:hypothetical protein [Dictyobacter arantiisoli]|uniref:Uncharacterized protein n=1 Tax=Dictyobacter arantiisoli TaxID=2014874 RepID=A0A5A5TIP0_9CHLR|nr:hypothetical protein [Dictyobacter arantiisoli]GCF11277.1 hypothetical protein KDI_48410 [Dictyobacter arantiisoli]